MGRFLASLIGDRPEHQRAGIVELYAVLGAANLLAWGLGAYCLPRLSGAARHRVPRLWLRLAPRGRCRSHRGHRQRHPQIDAAGQAPGRARLLLLARPFDRGRARRRRGRAHRRLVAQPFPACSRRSAESSAPASRRCSCSRSRWSICSSFRAVWRSFRHVRRGGTLAAASSTTLLSGRGLLARIFRPLFRLIGKSWHMYALGFLFGLGFDTATEIGLLGIAAAEASRGPVALGDAGVPAALHRRHDR